MALQQAKYHQMLTDQLRSSTAVHDGRQLASATAGGAGFVAILGRHARRAAT
jgi:hypothetical protein